MKGNKTYRHTNNPLEKKLHDSFIKEHLKPNRYLTDDEKRVAISTIQWLGSPVGQSFLMENGFNIK